MIDVTRRAILGAGLGVAAGAFAQTRPGIPVGLLASRVKQPGSSTYAWADAVAGVPFTTPTQPTAPTTSGGSVSVTPATIASHLNQSKEMTLGAGTYTLGDITGNHQKFILQSGAILPHMNINGAQYISIEGSGRTATVDHITVFNAADVSVYQIAIANAGEVQNFIRGQRVSFISCQMRMGTYCIWGDPTTTDLVVGNCDMQTGVASHATPTVRLQSVNRSVVHRCRIVNTQGQTCHRIHADAGDGASANHWLTDSQLEGIWGFYTPSGGGGASDGLSNIWCEDNHCYPGADNHNFGSTDNAPAMTALTMTGNNVHSTGNFYPNQLSGWNISGNTTSATSSAPAWTYA